MAKHHFPIIRRILTDWYEQNKRDLPWRNVNDAYCIWISEIILQQTRVNQGYNYYLRFVERFPDIASLAEADEQEVLKFWQGLGYYSRARNLHKAAKILFSTFSAQFPSDYKDILSLPGIGDYTAAAIASFAFNLPYATVDGNVFRVLSRLTADDTPIDTTKGKKTFTEIAQKLLDKKSPGTHNQAIMEFGALQCTPVSPNCEICPLADYCEAFRLNVVNQLPVKQGKTKVSNRYFNYFFIKNKNYTYLQKRTGKDIWRNLYEFPLVESEKVLNISDLMQSNDFKTLFEQQEIHLEKTSRTYKHVLSHQIIHAIFYTINIKGELKANPNVLKIPIENFGDFPVSRLMELFLEKVVN